MTADDGEQLRGNGGNTVVPRVGAVERCHSGALPWVVVDHAGTAVPEVSEYLLDGLARGFSASSIQSYARALLRWLRFLRAAGVPWDAADRVDVRNFVLWMRTATKVRSRRPDRPLPGSVNLRTGKQYLSDNFAPATINHNLAVVNGFYEYFIAQGRGPLRNPVPPPLSGTGGRVFAHQNPMDQPAMARRADYRQKMPRTMPRAIPDDMFNEIFECMTSHRDRAILAFYVSTAARPDELLGVNQACVNFGDQLIGVIRKGTRELQWLPASPDAFVWLRLYQNELPHTLVGPDQPVWWTLRRPWRRVNYEAMRAVLRRANTVLGTNWTLHDFRHTAAVRMAEDPNMPLVDIQLLLGHAHLSTTERYLRLRLDRFIEQVREHHHRTAQPILPSSDVPKLGYDTADMNILFGRAQPGRAL